MLCGAIAGAGLDGMSHRRFGRIGFAIGRVRQVAQVFLA